MLRADLGAVGRIDLTLVPSGVKKQARSACEKRSVSYEGATYEGTFEFHGEEGFTDLSASSRISLLHARRIQGTIHPPLDPSPLTASFPQSLSNK